MNDKSIDTICEKATQRNGWGMCKPTEYKCTLTKSNCYQEQNKENCIRYIQYQKWLEEYNHGKD